MNGSRRNNALRRPRILVAGLGNELLKDDGVGIHAVRMLGDDPVLRKCPDITVAEVGTAVLDAAHLYEWADYIVAVDAIQTGATPGTVHCIPDCAGMRTDEAAGGLHALNVLAALRLVPTHRVRRVVALGVEPEEIAYSMDLSATVQAALPALLAEVRRVLDDLQSAKMSKPAHA